MSQSFISNHDLNKWIDQLKSNEKLSELDSKKLCERAREILNNEDNVVKLQCPVTVSYTRFFNHLSFRSAETYTDSFMI